MRETFFNISKSRVKHNYRVLAEHVGKDLLVVLKANGYTHGAIEIGKILEVEGCSYFGVATLEEAIELRAHVQTPILVFGHVLARDFSLAVKHRITVTLHSKEQIEDLLNYEKDKMEDLKVHIKVDTGMNRLGLFQKDVNETILKLQAYGIFVEGLYSHFSTADEEDTSYYKKQLLLFQELLKLLKEQDIEIPYTHINNSAGTLQNDDPNTTLSRIGLALYGYDPRAFSMRKKELTLYPVGCFTTIIVQKRKIVKNEKVSYGGLFTVPEDGWIYTIPVGYADGFFRYNTNTEVYIPYLKKRIQIAGRVCMDQTILFSTEEIPLYEHVELFGEHIPVEEIADRGHTIIYEVLCGISERVVRRYMD